MFGASWIRSLPLILLNASLLSVVAQSTSQLPKLEVSPATVMLSEDGKCSSLTIKNSGTSSLHWVATTRVSWVATSSSLRLSEFTLSNDKSTKGLQPNDSDLIQICANTAGLKPGNYDGTIEFASDGGAARVNVSLASTVLNLNGLWVGALIRGSSPLLVSPTLALHITQTSSSISAQIDGRLSPAFATGLTRQAGEVRFERGAGSLAAGQLKVLSVDDELAVETWTLTAQGGDSFLVNGSATGPQGTASVGSSFASKAGGIAVQVLSSLNEHPYQKGDIFEFQVGHYGFAGPPLTGTLTGGIAATVPLDGPLLHLPSGSTRVFRISNFAIDDSGALVADFEIRYHGLSPTDNVISDKLRLIHQN